MLLFENGKITMMNEPSNELIDAFIPASVKDVPVLNICIPSLIKNIPQLNNIYISMPSRPNIEDTQINGHKIFFYNDFDVLDIKDNLTKIKFRPNWIYQQLLKMFQPVTTTKNWLVFDADCVLMKQLDLVDVDNKISVFRKLKYNDESGFNRFIYKATNGDLGIDVKNRRYSYTQYIVDFQLFNKQYINELIQKYFDTVDNFIKFVVDNTYYAGSSNTAIFLSEYELYGKFVEKYHKNEINITEIKQIEFSSQQMKSQNIAGYDNQFIANMINEYDSSEYDVIKFQTNCVFSDNIYAKPNLNKGN